MIETENQNVETNKTKFKLYSPFLHVKSGYVCVTEGLFTGKVKVQTPGVKLTLPTNARTFIPSVDTPVDFCKEKYKSSEGYQIIVDTAITYRITDHKTYYIQKNALQHLNIKISSILRRLISNCDYKKVSKLRINLRDDSNDQWSDPKVNGWIKKELSRFEKDYGILVEDLAIQRVELNEELRKSKEEDALVKAQNERNIKTAEANKKIAELNAAADRIHGMNEAEIEATKIAKIIEQIGGIDTPEKLKALRDIVIGSNAQYTILENTTGDQDFAKMAKFSAVNETINKPKTQRTNKANETEEVVTKTKTRKK